MNFGWSFCVELPFLAYRFCQQGHGSCLVGMENCFEKCDFSGSYGEGF